MLLMVAKFAKTKAGYKTTPQKRWLKLLLWSQIRANFDRNANVRSDGQNARTDYLLWPGMATGDIAFCLLEDLFLNSDSTKATIPGVGWNDILGPEDNLPAWEQLHSFIRKYGRKAIQSKWQAQWQKYKDRVFWDPKERCFKLKMA